MPLMVLMLLEWLLDDLMLELLMPLEPSLKELRLLLLMRLWL